MDKILFNDNLTVKKYENGKIEEFSCDFHDNYIDRAKRAAQNNEWKTQGEGARFRGDAYARLESENQVTDRSYFNSLSFDASGEKILYSVTVDRLSAMVSKIPDHEKENETNIIHSQSLVFRGCSPSKNGKKLCTCVKPDYVTSHLAEYDLMTNDYATLTYGDCADGHARYSEKSDNVILFDTKGAGRDGNGEFVRYSPSSVCRYHTDSFEIEEILSSPDRSYERPYESGNGDLYFIEKPVKEKKEYSVGRTLLDILLLPWRLLKAVYCFLETFTMLFTGKGFSRHDPNPAKNNDKNPQQIYVEGNLVNADREYKNNLRHKDAFAGIAPHAWVLKKKDAEGKETELCHGVIDYSVLSDGSVVYTNGKNVIVTDGKGKHEKIASATLCTCVASFPEITSAPAQKHETADFF